jgi:hypothetical protein
MSRVFSTSKGVQKYGMKFSENMDDLGIELYCYAISRGDYGKDYCVKHNINLKDFKLLTPAEHFLNAVKLQWPTEVSIYNRGYTNTQLLRTLEELCNNTDICLAGAASMGKSFPVALWIYLDWCSAPHCTSAWVATTTLGASEDRIWGIISKLWKCANIQIGKLIDYRHMIVWGGASNDEDKDYRNAIKALAFQSGNEGQKAIDTTRGRKNDRVRLALDELPEMELGAITARVNLSANDDVTFIGIGNPSAGDNPHTRWAMPKGKSNFDSVTPDMMDWETETGICLFYNGMKSPNFDARPDEPSPFPFLMDRKKQEMMLKQCYGDENAIDYVRNAIGWWPKSGFIQTVITSDLIRNADTNEEPLWDSEGFTKVAGFDTSFTIGGDRCVLTIAKLGFVRGTRNRVMWLESQKVIQLSANASVEFEIQLATEVVSLCKSAGVQPTKFGMDVSGDGGRVGQAIIREWLRTDSTGAAIALISSMGKPTDRIAAEVDRRPCSDVYDRLVSEYYYSAYHAFKSRVIFGVDSSSDLARELCLRRYTIKNKKIAIETKDNLKKRTGYSPDCFVEGTLILTPNGQTKIEDLRSGDEVITPFGITKIAFIHDEIHNEICKVEFSDGRILEGKGKHRVFTWEDGWVRLDKLSSAYTIESQERLIIWNILNSLFTINENIAFKHLVDIIKTETKIRQRDFYIELFGSNTMGLFLKVLKSIISMAIGQITESKIWRFLANQNICDCICKKESKTKILESVLKKILNLQEKRQKNGTLQKREGSGIANTPTIVFSNENSTKEVASIAENQSLLKTKTSPSIVVEPAFKMQIVKSIKQILLLALYVLKSLSLNRGISAIVAPSVVRSSKETRDARVLNLVLENQNVYYANGILVDNCSDSLIYALEMARRNGLVFIGNDKPVPTNRFWAREEKQVEYSQDEEYSVDDWGED